MLVDDALEPFEPGALEWKLRQTGDVGDLAGILALAGLNNDLGDVGPVLLEGEYISKVGVNTFPTTWFLDPEGRIVFEKVGVLDDLEIEWRLQALLEPKADGGNGKKD